MKQFFRFAIVTLMLLISTSSFAQLEGMFYSQEYMDDVEAFKGTIKGSIKTRCEKLKQLGHMNDEGEIQYQYVIKLKDSLDISRFMETVRAWAEVNYKDAKKQLVEETDDMVEYTAVYAGVGQFNGPFKLSVINATAFSKIEAKPDRIRITSRVKHYSLSQGSLAGAKQELTLPKEVYPFVDCKDKNTYGMAYINSNLRLIANVASIIDYLNKNYDKIEKKKKDNEDW